MNLTLVESRPDLSTQASISTPPQQLVQECRVTSSQRLFIQTTLAPTQSSTQATSPIARQAHSSRKVGTTHTRRSKLRQMGKGSHRKTWWKLVKLSRTWSRQVSLTTITITPCWATTQYTTTRTTSTWSTTPPKTSQRWLFQVRDCYQTCKIDWCQMLPIRTTLEWE